MCSGEAIREEYYSATPALLVSDGRSRSQPKIATQLTMALAREITDNDPFTLRMVKWATNAAQDAMGFSEAVRIPSDITVASTLCRGDF